MTHFRRRLTNMYINEAIRKNMEHGTSNVITINTDRSCINCGKTGSVGKNSFCLACVADSVKFKIPKEHDFDAENTDFMAAPEIADIGRKLIKTYDEEFHQINFADIGYFWKKKGGKNKLGQCQKPTGLLKHFSEMDFIVWLAADHCQFNNYYQITALVFHELKHAGYNPENGEYEIKTHDFEGFNSEVEIFGAWKRDIVAMQKAFADAVQPKLFD